MKTLARRKRLLVFGCMISLLVLSAALYSEAVDAAAAFDFNTPVEWNAFRASMELVGIEHFNLEAHDVVALAGMIAILLWAISTRANMPTWGLIGYSAVYFATGGLLGLVAIAFGWFLAPIDGEFFQDRTASFLAHGVWGYTLVMLIILRLAVRTKTAEQLGAANPGSFLC
jgi:cytochrome b561